MMSLMKVIRSTVRRVVGDLYASFGPGQRGVRH